MTAEFDPNQTLIQKANEKMTNPAVTWVMLAAIISATGTGTFFISGLEASIGAAVLNGEAMHAKAMAAIDHEATVRVITMTQSDKNVDEIKTDIEALEKEVRDGNKETQELLRKLLQQQAGHTG